MKDFLNFYNPYNGLNKEMDLNIDSFKIIYKSLHCNTNIFNEKGMQWIDEHYSNEELLNLNSIIVSESMNNLYEIYNKSKALPKKDLKKVDNIYLMLENASIFNTQTQNEIILFLKKTIEVLPNKFSCLGFIEDEFYSYYPDIFIKEIELYKDDNDKINDNSIYNILEENSHHMWYYDSLLKNKTSLINYYDNCKYCGLIPLMLKSGSIENLEKLFTDVIEYIIDNYKEKESNKDKWEHSFLCARLKQIFKLTKKFFEEENAKFDWFDRIIDKMN